MLNTLAALLSDLAIEGAYVAPDRTQAILRFQQNQLEVRAIGEKTWVTVDGRFQEREASGRRGGIDAGCRLQGRGAGNTASLEDVKSEARHDQRRRGEALHSARHDLESLPELLGASSDADLPEKFQVNLWLAEEGRWPVRLDIGAQDVDDQGQIIGLTLNMEFRDVNDPGIGIDAAAGFVRGGLVQY